MRIAFRRWRLRMGLLCACAVAAGTCVAQATQDEVARLNAEARALLRSDPQQAQQRAQQALQLAQRQHDRSGEAAARVNLGSVERQRGRYGSAVLEFERAVAIARAASDQAGYASAQANLGITLDLGGLHADALEAQGEALKIYEAQGKYASASAVLINLGNTLDNLGDPARAREHYQRALEMKQAHGIEKGIGAVLNNLADLTLEAGATQQAIELLDRAIAAHERDGDRVGQGLALSNRGVAHGRDGHFDAALADIQRGEAIARDLEHAVGISAALRARGEVWLLRAHGLEGEARDYALLNAEREARAAVVASNEQDDPARRARAKRLLANILAAKGDAVNAIALMEEIEREAAAQRRQRDDARVALVRARYEGQQAEAEVTLMRERAAAQAAELGRSRILLRSAIGVGIAALVAIVLLVWIGRDRRLRAETLAAQDEVLRDALAQAEHQARRAREAAELNQRLLALAGEDLQGPLAEIRGSAERLLAVHHANPEWSRPMAAIARTANDLLQTVVRLRETAQQRDDLASPHVDLSELLARCVSEAEARARQRQQRLQAAIAPAIAVCADVDSMVRLCAELLDQTLRRNPADSNIAVALRAEAAHAVLTLSDHDGELRSLLLDAQRASGAGDSETPRRLGLGLLRETILRAGGSIDSIAASAPETGQLLRVLLPLAA